MTKAKTRKSNQPNAGDGLEHRVADKDEEAPVWYWRRNIHRRPDSKGKREGKPQLEYNWVEIDKKIQEVLEKFSFKPTMRELNYALISLSVIPNLHKTYKSLDSHMVKAREELGTFPIDCLADDRHPIVDINDVYNSPEDWIIHYIKKLRDLAKDYHDPDSEYIGFPRWEGQKNYVEIWTEKQAMSKHFNNVVTEENLQVRIVPFGGFPGTSELNDHVKRLKQKMSLGKNVHILWFGDKDPSGESIDRSTIEKLKRVFAWRLDRYARRHRVTFDLERIAITKEQIREYDLPWNAERMSEEEQEKLQNDPRYKKHVHEHNQVYACELDSLPVKRLDVFNRIVVEAINGYFDEDVHNDGLEQHDKTYTEEYIKDALYDYVPAFAKELEQGSEEDEDEDEDE